MKISVIGTGYVGLVSGVCLAEKGHNVVCVDIDKQKVDNINDAIAPIHENGLDALLEKNLHNRFSATDDLSSAVLNSDISIIAVGTPFDGELIDLSFIENVSRELGNVLKNKNGYHVVVVKSTVVPGTTDDFVLPIIEKFSGKKAGRDFGVGMNPEFLREGEAIDDFMNPDRIVIGGIDERTREVLADIYKVFHNVEIVQTNNKTAEMIKYTANSLLATLISFSNEMGNLCADLKNVDVTDVMRGVHLDKRFLPFLPDGNRVRPGFLSYVEAGCGFGGSCFPKDVKALIAHGKRAGNSMSLLESVISINEKQPYKIISLLEKHFENYEGKNIAILGLAFKPNTDDMRESPAIPVVNYLQEKGVKISAYDPVAYKEAEKIFGNHQITYNDDLESIILNADAVILLTSWKEFYKIPDLINKCKKQPLFIDGRRMLSKEQFEKYEGIGLS